MKFFWRKKESRAEPIAIDNIADEALLTAIINQNVITRDDLLQIPTVRLCIDLLSGIVSGLPIKLYRLKGGKVEEKEYDKRLDLLNRDTGDTLSAVDFWRAIIEDYFLGIGAFAYINRKGNQIESLHYVDERSISIQHNVDKIFKSYVILVDGKWFENYEFFKVFRHTKTGYGSARMNTTNSIIASVVKNSLLYEDRLVRKGGNKRGFLTSDSRLTEEAMAGLKAAFRRLYANNDENVMVLNKGINFQESSNTSVEMQLAQNKKANAEELGKLFGIPKNFINGTPTKEDYSNLIKFTVTPLLTAIECSLDRDLLLEREKHQKYYFAFDTKEMTRGTITERYEAYKIGLDKNFLQIDEVRKMEDMEPLGFKWVTLGLNQVLYDPQSNTIYTPNTNQIQKDVT